MEKYPKLYFIEAIGVGLVKIGTSHFPNQRLRNLQTGSPVELRLLGYIDGGKSAEEELHVKLKRWWARGEWFYLADEVRRTLRRLLPPGLENSATAMSQECEKSIATRKGQAIARANGKTWGGSKPGKRWRVTADQIDVIRLMSEEGKSKSEMVRATGLSRPTVYSVLRDTK